MPSCAFESIFVANVCNPSSRIQRDDQTTGGGEKASKSLYSIDGEMPAVTKNKSSRDTSKSLQWRMSWQCSFILHGAWSLLRSKLISGAAGDELLKRVERAFGLPGNAQAVRSLGS